MGLRTSSAALAALAVVSFGAAAQAGTHKFDLSDHPDGNASPPGYGLRLDHLFDGRAGASGGTTTFSFEPFNVSLIVNDDDPGMISINIVGTVYGGEDSGSGYGYGEGAYAVDFTYAFNVVEDGTGWRVTPANAGNNGTLTSLGNADVAAGETFSFFDFDSTSFLFLQDDHRLGGHSEAGMGYWVGRGWLTLDEEGDNRRPTKDWLFIGKVVPAPTGVAMGAVGLVALCARRRR